MLMRLNVEVMVLLATVTCKVRVTATVMVMQTKREAEITLAAVGFRGPVLDRPQKMMILNILFRYFRRTHFLCGIRTYVFYDDGEYDDVLYVRSIFRPLRAFV